MKKKQSITININGHEVILDDTKIIVTGKQIGRASCRERV